MLSCPRLLAPEQPLHPLVVDFVLAAFQRHNQIRDVQATRDPVDFGRAANDVPASFSRVVGGHAYKLCVSEARVFKEVERSQ